MAITVACDKCGASYKIDETRIPATGGAVKCQRCGERFVVHPGGSAPVGAVAAVAPPPAPAPAVVPVAPPPAPAPAVVPVAPPPAPAPAVIPVAPLPVAAPTPVASKPP